MVFPGWMAGSASRVSRLSLACLASAAAEANASAVPPRSWSTRGAPVLLARSAWPDLVAVRAESASGSVYSHPRLARCSSPALYRSRSFPTGRLPRCSAGSDGREGLSLLQTRSAVGSLGGFCAGADRPVWPGLTTASRVRVSGDVSLADCEVVRRTGDTCCVWCSRTGCSKNCCVWCCHTGCSTMSPLFRAGRSEASTPSCLV